MNREEKKRKTENVILIGMPGVGKSTVGVILAKILGYRFVDTDLLIQEQEGRKLKDIIEEEGTDGFLRIENDLCRQLHCSRSVIATGGSVVYGKEAMEHLGEIGTVVYLKQNLRRLKRRLRNIKNRGVVQRPGQTLEDIFRERERLYQEYADVTVEEKGLSVEETITVMRKALAAFKNGL